MTLMVSIIYFSKEDRGLLLRNSSAIYNCVTLGNLLTQNTPLPPGPMVISSNIGRVWLCHMPLSDLKIGKQNEWPWLLKLISFHPRVGESARECMVMQ